MRKFISVLLLACALTVAPLSNAQAQRRSGNRPASLPKAGSSLSALAREDANNITAAQLKNYLSFIASDEMEGRDTPSRGLDTTAKFIALNLARWGFKPAGDDGTYFQSIALRRTKIDPATTRMESGGRQYAYGEDFLAQPFATGSATGALVYVGNGWIVKSKNINPYQSVNVKDKIVVVSDLGTGNGLPKGVTRAELTGKNGEDWADPAQAAAKNGAKAIIYIPDYQSLASWDRVRQTQLERGNLFVEKFQTQDAPRLPLIVLSPKTVQALFLGEKQTASVLFNKGITGEAVESFELNANKTVNLNVGVKAETLKTQNVVAVLEGSDPVLKNEYVALGAHYDHVGVGAPGAGRSTPKEGDASRDVIYNGADDDGSGTTALLAMAETLGREPQRPRRSILFVWHCGEEKGLWGSRYFTQNPTIPLNQVVTQINIDMIGRSRFDGDAKAANKELSNPNEIYVIGSKMMSTELGDLSARVNKDYLNLAYNYRYDDVNDPNRFFFRSDHFNYAQKGVPIIFFFDGVHEDYHRPTDSADKIDYQKMEKVTRTIYITMQELANANARPRVDKQLPQELRN
ncbi:MAG: M20/M25/M40 family metallo-hydrolase [Pyrinomonadaceae bacterium]